MLIEDLKKGSSQAFRALVEAFSPDVIKTCYGFVNSREDAEDIAQEVFIEIYRSIHQFREDADLKTWIFRIAINKSLDFLRKRQRKKRIANLRELFSLKSKAEIGPHQQLEEVERREILHEQIALLSENQRIALILSQFEQMPNAQIAQIMSISDSAVESLLHRARRNLRKKLGNYFEKKIIMGRRVLWAMTSNTIESDKEQNCET